MSEKVEREKRQLLTTLLNQLDAHDANEQSRHERRSIRATFRRFDVRAIVHHPGGSSTERRVLTRDLSAGGLNFIHSGYLHVGTRCDIVLTRYLGGEDTICGQVTHCSHISGNWHTVGIKFDCKIFPRLYLDPDQATGVDVDTHNPQGIRGQVLLLDSNELDRRLIAHHLRNTSIELTSVPTLAEAITAMETRQESPFDLVLVDFNLSGDQANLPAVDVVNRILEHIPIGRTGVAVCTAETKQEILTPVQALPIRGLLRKPHDAEKVLSSLGTWLGTVGVGHDEPIASVLASQPEMAALLTEFVENARKLGHALEVAAGQDLFDRCRAICVTLRGSGSSYGFSIITQAADEAVKVLEAHSSVAKASIALQRLQDLCRRVTDRCVDESGKFTAQAA